MILCYLEGMAYETAAQHLRCPVGTLSIRLKRARERLRSRLTRRGLDFTAGFLVAGPPSRATSVRVSASLVESTTRVVMRNSVGEAVLSGLRVVLHVFSRTRSSESDAADSTQGRRAVRHVAGLS